jgi:hypothetical protein
MMASLASHISALGPLSIHRCSYPCGARIISLAAPISAPGPPAIPRLPEPHPNSRTREVRPKRARLSNLTPLNFQQCSRLRPAVSPVTPPTATCRTATPQPPAMLPASRPFPHPAVAWVHPSFTRRGAHLGEDMLRKRDEPILHRHAARRLSSAGQPFPFSQISSRPIRANRRPDWVTCTAIATWENQTASEGAHLSTVMSHVLASTYT